MEPSGTPTSFPKFALLAPELRIKIWRYAIPRRRTIRLRFELENEPWNVAKARKLPFSHLQRLTIDVDGGKGKQTLQLKPSQTSRWIPPPPLTQVNREARHEALPWFRTSLLLSHEDSWVFSGLHLRGAGRVTPEDAATYPCRWRFEGFEPTTDVLEFAYICKGLEKMLRSLVVLLPSTVRHLSLEYDAPLSHLNDLFQAVIRPSMALQTLTITIADPKARCHAQMRLAPVPPRPSSTLQHGEALADIFADARRPAVLMDWSRRYANATRFVEVEEEEQPPLRRVPGTKIMHDAGFAIYWVVRPGDVSVAEQAREATLAAFPPCSKPPPEYFFFAPDYLAELAKTMIDVWLWHKSLGSAFRDPTDDDDDGSSGRSPDVSRLFTPEAQLFFHGFCSSGYGLPGDPCEPWDSRCLGRNGVS